MFFITMIVNGVLLVSTEPVALDKCQAFKAQNPTTLCIEQELDCGLAAGLEPCKGVALDEPAKKRVTTRRTRR